MALMIEFNEDVGNALFGLGRFIDYRLDEGMQEDWLFPYMQSYLNLSYRFRGLALPDLHELRARKVVLSPKEQEDLRAVSPTWLPDAEKYALLFSPDDSDQSTSDPDESEALVSD